MVTDKRTPKKWTEELGIIITDNLLKGFDSFASFYNIEITKNEYYNRLARCDFFYKRKQQEDKELTYSMKETVFRVDKHLELQANSDVNLRGSNCVLEGATDLQNGKYRLWYRKLPSPNFEQEDIIIKLTDERKTVPVKQPLIVSEIKTPKYVATENDKYFEFIPKQCSNNYSTYNSENEDYLYEYL